MVTVMGKQATKRISISLLCLTASLVTVHARDLTFEDRVRAQEAVEQVYWRHRVWPKENAGPKPPLSAVMPDSAIRAKVEESLRMSALLDSYWRQPLRGELLQAEIDRMAARTQAPEMLHELFDALGNDPVLIAECLARPVLAERLVAQAFADDERIHGAQRAALASKLAGVRDLAVFESLDAEHSNVTLVLAEESAGLTDRSDGSAAPTIHLTREEWDAEIGLLAESLGGDETTGPGTSRLPLDRPSRLIDLGDRFIAILVRARTAARITLASVSWPKRTYDDWTRERAGSSIIGTDSTITGASSAIAPPEGGYTMPAVAGGCTYDTWTPTTQTNAPAPRRAPSAVWTGTEMIVWGGVGLSGVVNTGGRYNPATDSWSATSTAAPVPPARFRHGAVWTGTRMIVWGGFPNGGGATNTGGVYNPAANTWTATSTGTNVPAPRSDQATVWTGGEMIVWGGFGGIGGVYPVDGGRYLPGNNSWFPISTSNAPAGRLGPSAVFDGVQMIVWGGLNDGGVVNTGGRWRLTADSWSATSTGANVPSPRSSHTAIWTGSEMIVSGGVGSGSLYTGGKYNPSADTWAASSLTTGSGANSPAGRAGHTAVWTGFEMIVWGGVASSGSTQLNNGGRYVPSSDAWFASSLTTGSGANVPAARSEHVAVWTGSFDQRMIVWGGRLSSSSSDLTSSGAIYCAGECPHGSACSDGQRCTTSDVCTMGTCAGDPVVCTPIDPCHDPGFCDLDSGNCTIGAVKPNGVSCSDGNACTTGDACQSGVCQSGTAVVCTALDQCHDVGICNTGTGVCSNPNKANGTGCNDSNACTQTDTCQGGVCSGSNPVVCTALDQCHDIGTCNTGTGVCTNPNKANGSTCSDGNACTASCPTCAQDACFGGVCGCGTGPCDQSGSYAEATVASTDVPKDILAAGTPVVTSTLTVSIPGSPIVYDLDVQTFLRHTNASNLDITLRSPQGTVVTLTSDNGGANDDVFNGTVWDDDANPGGQVPYVSNDGLATDHGYANATLASPLAPEEALGAFNGENPNGTWTLTISDDTVGDGGALDAWSLRLATIAANAPSETQQFFSATGLPLPLSDPGPNPPPLRTKTITVSGAGFFISKVKVSTSIMHSNNADLDITIGSPQGTVVTLTTDNGGTADNVFNNTVWRDDANPGGQVPYTSNDGLVADRLYSNNINSPSLVPEEGLAAFRGENPNGVWTLAISDDTTPNGGTLNGFSLEITTATCPVSCVVDCGDGDPCTNDSCDPALGCAYTCNSGSGCVPGEVSNISMSADETTITWDHATGGTTSVHDLTRGDCGEFPVGAGANEVCVASGIVGTTATDPTLPTPGKALWYNVRGRHLCGAGTYGSQSDGTTRMTSTCP